MKHSTEVKHKIIKLKNKGLSGQQVANILGVSKTTVNDTYLRHLATPKINVNKSEPSSKILFIDIETFPDIAVTFKRFKANLSQDNILKNGGGILSISWRWMGDEKAQGMVLTSDEAQEGVDSRLCAVLFALIEKADVLVGHNIDNFDLPIIKARMVVNKFSAIKKVKTIDTLKIARQMRFPSNRLGSLGVILEEGDKASHSGINTWIGCMAGDQKYLDEMLMYNLEDVDLLYRVYMRLRNHDSRPLNLGLFTESEHKHCPVCGSTNIEETGNVVYTQVSKFKEHECNDCGSRSRSRTAINTKEKRKNLLV